MMKKFLFILLLISMLVSFAGCSSNAAGDKALMGEWKIVSREFDVDLINGNKVLEVTAMAFGASFPENSHVILKADSTMELPKFNVQVDYKVEDNKIFIKDLHSGNWNPTYISYTIIDTENMIWNVVGITFELEKQ